MFQICPYSLQCPKGFQKLKVSKLTFDNYLPGFRNSRLHIF